MNEIITFIKNSPAKLIAIVGPAASGKSTLSQKICQETSSVMYEGDNRFIGDSNYRKHLLSAKSKDYSNYLDLCDMMNWWDWNIIESDLYKLKHGYRTDNILPSDKTIYNNAILGNDRILTLIDKILFLHVPQEERFNRLIERDSGKRTFKELLARFLLTEYAENLHYNHLFKYYKNKMIGVEHDKFAPIDISFLQEKQYCPIMV